MKKPGKLILIAVWQFITAFMSLIVIAAVEGGPFSLSVYYILLLLCFMAFAVAGGIGLLLNRGRAWVRTVSIVHSALSLFFPPIIGTAIGTLSIIYLAKQDVTDYFNPPSPPK